MMLLPTLQAPLLILTIAGGGLLVFWLTENRGTQKDLQSKHSESSPRPAGEDARGRVTAEL